MSGSVAIVGAGSKLSYSFDDITFTLVAQLQRFKPGGSKQSMIDQTNLLTTMPFVQPQATRVDSGDADLAGVLYPGNASQQALGTIHANRDLVWWKLLLNDGVTVYLFQGFVSELKPFDIDVAKFVPFTAKLRWVGEITGPGGTF